MVPTQYKKTPGAIINCGIGWDIHKDQGENCPLDKKISVLEPPGAFLFMAYSGKFHPKGVPFSGFRYMKGWGNLSFPCVKKPKRANRCIL